MKPLVVALAVVAVAASSLAMYFFARPSQSTVAPVAADTPAPPTDDHAQEVAQLREELAKAEARVDELEVAAATPVAAPAPEPAAEPEPEEKPAEKKPSLEEIRASLAKNGQVGAQIQALTELMFADLLNGLDLDPETKAALRQLLLDEQMEEIALSQYAMMEGDIPWSQVAKWREEERAILDQEMQGLLSKEAYAKWQQSAGSFDDRQLDASLRNQIRTFASGLTDENYETVMQVAMDEFRAEQIALDRSNTTFTVAENLNYQIRAMENMRTRLQEGLPADQFTEINNWLNMGINMFEQQLNSMAQQQRQ